METNTEQINSLATVRAIVQNDNERKEEILKTRSSVVLSANDMEDPKKMTNTYKAAVEKNNEVIDFIVDVKNDILKIRLVKDRLDKTTALYSQQVQQFDYYIKLLSDIKSIMQDEREKMDRVIRFYERNYSTYSF